MNIEAFVIKKQTTNEYDALVTLYSKEIGRVEAVAKSIMKPTSIQSMHVGAMNLITCDLVEGKSYPIITGAQSEKTFSKLKSNLSSLAIANYICESVYKMTFTYQADDELWNFLKSTFSDLNTDKEQDHNALLKFGSELLSVLGYYPNTEQCAFCSKDEVDFAAFSPELVGMICGDCFLSGRKGILVKKGEHPVEIAIQSIFESLTGSAFHSLTFAKAVLQ